MTVRHEVWAALAAEREGGSARSRVTAAMPVHPHRAHKVQTPPAEMEMHGLTSLGVGKTEAYCHCL